MPTAYSLHNKVWEYFYLPDGRAVEQEALVVFSVQFAENKFTYNQPIGFILSALAGLMIS